MSKNTAPRRAWWPRHKRTRRGQVRLGIDVGTSAVKAVWAEGARGGTARFLEQRIEPLPDGSTEATQAALLRLLTAPPAQHPEVRMAMAGPDIIMRYLVLPTMSESDMTNAIRFEGESYIPFPLSEVVLDRQILEQVDAHKMRVLLAAAKRETVTRRMALAKGCGLTVAVMDIDALAVANAFLADTAGAATDVTTAVANIGARYTNLVILRKGLHCSFSRDLSFGGQHVVKAIEEQLGVRPAEAEQLMLQPGERQEQVGQSIRRALEQLTSELRLSFDFYETQSEDTVARLILSGGGSLVSHVVPFVKEHAGVPTEPWTPSGWLERGANGASVSPEAAARLAVCIGLVVRA